MDVIDIKKFRCKVRIVALGREQYTGKIGKITFVDGLSEEVSYAQAMSVGAVIASEVAFMDDNGDFGAFGPANPAALAAILATDREELPPETIAVPSVAIEPFLLKETEVTDYHLSASDAGYLINFTQGCQVWVPSDLPEGFYCSLRQGGPDQIEVLSDEDEDTGDDVVVIEEIDDLFFSERRLAILHLARFPDGSFQLTGRTGEAQ